jgi:hypothetical protein
LKAAVILKRIFGGRIFCGRDVFVTSGETPPFFYTAVAQLICPQKVRQLLKIIVYPNPVSFSAVRRKRKQDSPFLV